MRMDRGEVKQHLRFGPFDAAPRESIGSEIWSDKLATWVRDEIAPGVWRLGFSAP